MKPIQRFGLIVNPVAGGGLPDNLQAARKALAALSARQVMTGPGDLGANALEGMSFEPVVMHPGKASGREQTQALARCLAETGLIEVLVVVGGDGTMADVAHALIDLSHKPAILGIGAGSTNVGALITCQMEDLDQLAVDKLEMRPLPAVLAYDQSGLLGIGFNDCVFGFTVITTVNGALRDVQVKAKIDGENISAQPEAIGTPATLVERLGPAERTTIARGSSVGAIVVGLAESRFIGKAVTGGVCLAALSGVPAGCLVADHPLVQIEISREDVLRLPPLHSIYTSLDTGLRIRVSGVRLGTALCVDGNPLKLLDSQNWAEVGVSTNAITSIHLHP